MRNASESSQNCSNVVDSLNIRLADLDLSVRSANCLTHAGLVYVGDLVQKTGQDLLTIRHFGRGCLKEIEVVLSRMGLTLGFTLLGPDWAEQTGDMLAKRLTPPTLQKTSLLDDPETADKLIRKIEELDLPFRAINCLHTLGIKYIGDLVQKTPQDLIVMANFGRKSLSDTSRKLSSIGLSLNMKVDGWSELRSGSSSRGRENESAEGQKPLFVHETPQVRFLEEELYFIACLIKGDNYRHTLVTYYGWDGQGRKSLRAIGSELGITYERVRQIVAKFETKIKTTKVARNIKLPIFEKVLHFIEEFGLGTKETIEDKLYASGLVRDHFRLRWK